MQLAKNLGVETMTLPIEPLMLTFDTTLKDALGAEPPGVALENFRRAFAAICRWALSNARGAMFFTTGNKSALSVG